MNSFEFRLETSIKEGLYDQPVHPPDYPEIPPPPEEKLPANYIEKRGEFLKVLPGIIERIGETEEWDKFLNTPEVKKGGLTWEKAWQFFEGGIELTRKHQDEKEILEYYQQFCDHEWNDPVEHGYDSWIYYCPKCQKIVEV